MIRLFRFVAAPLLIISGLTTLLNASFYYEQATKEDTDTVASFCYEQNLPTEAFFSYLQRDPNKWLYMAIDLDTENIVGIIAGKYDKAASQVSIDTIRTTTNNNLTEILLRYVLCKIEKQGFKSYSMPVQELFRSGMKSLRTDINATLSNFAYDSMRYVLYPASRFAVSDQETKDVLRKLSQMRHSCDTQTSKVTISDIHKQATEREKTHAQDGCATAVAYFKDIIVGIATRTTQNKMDVFIENGFENLDFNTTLIEQLINFTT
ncbi:hypothetical protein FJ364_00865 [Candidatus Dependentiae bacterium]|nr:hypothetical protein [Candidatus Dependentiae bacterium]